MTIKSNCKSKVVDFSGKNIFIGLDDHLKHWNVALYSQHVHHKTFQQEVDAEGLRSYLDRHFPGADYYSVCEVGFKGFTTHRQLEAVGIKNLVVNPSDVPTKDRERKQKRDPADAQKLARALRGGNLDGLYVPSKEAEQDRALVRYRCNNLVPKLTRIKNQIRSYLHYHGKPIPAKFKGKRWNKDFKSWLKEVSFQRTSARLVLDELLGELADYEERLRRVNHQILALSKEKKYAARVKLLRSIPGVGLLTAMVLLTELITMERFKDLDSLCAYLGLVPNVYASGDKERVGRQTNRGHKNLCRLWIQASWRARSLDPALLEKYEELRAQKMKPQKAIIRIAKKLLSKMRYVWNNGELYQKGIK